MVRFITAVYWYIDQKLASYIVKDVRMRNEASPESVRPVIRPVICPLSIRSIVHAN
jgi:hypothetical protein